MIRWMKQKANTKAEARKSGYKIYIRYDERQQLPIQQIVSDHVDWQMLLNGELYFDNEDDLVKSLVFQSIYIYNDGLIRYVELSPSIKILVFDIVVVPFSQVESKFTPSNNAYEKFNINSKDENVSKYNPTKLLQENINKGEINVG